jgi:hypothetical protein
VELNLKVDLKLGDEFLRDMTQKILFWCSLKWEKCLKIITSETSKSQAFLDKLKASPSAYLP